MTTTQQKTWPSLTEYLASDHESQAQLPSTITVVGTLLLPKLFQIFGHGNANGRFGKNGQAIWTIQKAISRKIISAVDTWYLPINNTIRRNSDPTLTILCAPSEKRPQIEEIINECIEEGVLSGRWSRLLS